jgi:hypothetical protein
MRDLLVGLGLVLVIEGLIWAAYPGLAKRLLEIANETNEATLRMVGAATIAAGVLVVWLVRG